MKTTHRMNGPYLGSMLTNMLLVAGIALASCQGNNDGRAVETDQTDVAGVSSEAPIRPRTDVVVNHRYDSHGNLVSFDSTYTSFYSNVPADTVRMNSVMSTFKPHFQESKTPWFGYRDSLRHPDLFHNDVYFQDRKRRTDSVMNQHFWKGRAQASVAQKNT